MFSFSASKRDERQSFDLVEDKGHKEGLKRLNQWWGATTLAKGKALICTISENA